MTLTIGLADPAEPGIAALLAGLHALYDRLVPSSEEFILDVGALKRPDIRFFAAREWGVPVGCGAPALRKGYGEIKSMYVDPAAQRRGIAGMILATLEAESVSHGLTTLRLETATPLTAAVELYARHGFTSGPRFGDYPDDPRSVFMEKRLR
jgi:putative acetyltransferase